jgi:deoxyadenosine/deoxycytidine kinase
VRDELASVAKDPKMLVVAGNIATGKTCLLEKIGKTLELPTFPERWQENPWFAPDRRNVFLAQLWFLLEAGADHARMAIRGAVQERCIHEHARVFAPEYLAGAEAHLLAEVYAQLDAALPDPDVLIYLKASVPELLVRVRNRGRAQEQSLTEVQLERLDSRYDDLIGEWSRCPILEIDTEAVDVRSAEGVRHILERVTEVLR